MFITLFCVVYRVCIVFSRCLFCFLCLCLFPLVGSLSLVPFCVLLYFLLCFVYLYHAFVCWGPLSMVPSRWFPRVGSLLLFVSIVFVYLFMLCCLLCVLLSVYIFVCLFFRVCMGVSRLCSCVHCCLTCLSFVSIVCAYHVFVFSVCL